MATHKLSPTKFDEIAQPLEKLLTEQLQRDIEDCALPELAEDPHTDLWTTPKVDSKTVVKLSATVKEFTGFRLDPTWIQKGGYSTVAAAITHVMAEIKKHCVAESAPVRQPAVVV